MTMRLVPILAAAALLASPAAAQELSEGNLPKVLEFVTPDAGECRWEAIPWHSTFWDGVIEANAKDRPILLWAMNGHPLGCT